MAKPSSADTEAISTKIADLRSQIRSYAQQRAEGLIDADLQRDLVKDLQSEINDLQAKLDNNTSDSAGSDVTASEPEHAESEMVEEMLAEDESGESPDEDTHEHPDVKVTEATDTPEHADKEAVAEAIKEDKAEADDSEHAQAEMVEEMLAEDESGESPNEDTHEHPDVKVTEASDKAEHADNEAVVEVIEEEAQLDKDTDESAIKLGDFTEDIVVSSAMVKEPSYLNEIHEPNVVDIRDITKTYQMGEFELEVLKGITLQVRQGEFVSIMGPSGSGKSTLMNILGALDQPTAGDYFLDNVDVSKLDERSLAEIRNQKIGFVFQSFNLLKRTPAIRQVELPLIYGSHKDRSRRAREALESVGLGQRLDHTPAELSGGQQQRVAIARALVTEPSLILADEPTGNLDSRSGTEVMQIFQTLNRKNNITTIFVTHDPWIARHTDRVIMLRDGKIIADQRVKNPLVAGEAERPSEAEELQAIFDSTYYGGDEEEYT